MSEILRCPTCNGKKTILGGGMMNITCTTCFGLGKLEIKSEQKSAENKARIDSRETLINEQPKRRGRKPKTDA